MTSTITDQERAALDAVISAFHQPLYRADIRTFSSYCRNIRVPDCYRAFWVCKEIQRGLVEAKKRAVKKNLEYSLDEDEIISRLYAQGLRCAVSNVPFRKEETWDWYRNPYRPSIDRINSLEGYVPENVRIVAYCANAAMNEWGEEILFEMVRCINDRPIPPDGALKIEAPTESDKQLSV